jgi:hypothetical protein
LNSQTSSTYPYPHSVEATGKEKRKKKTASEYEATKSVPACLTWTPQRIPEFAELTTEFIKRKFTGSSQHGNNGHYAGR